MKGNEWNKKVKVKANDKAEDVVIFIGLIHWRQEERKLKPARGKRVALKRSNQAPYAEVRSKGIQKWKAYHSNDFAEDEEYSLVYQDGQEALFLPGTREFFTAKRYKEQSGKDYKRITLYLCTKNDLRRNEDFDIESETDDFNIESETEDECAEPTGKKSKPQVNQDELIARETTVSFHVRSW